MRTLQRGVAIVLAMGVVALAAIAAAAILVSQSTWSRQTELVAAQVQAQAVLQAGADWARAVLSDDLRISRVDHLGEPWALRLPAMQVENGELVGHIEDQQGVFNLNNVVTEGKVSVVQLAHFRRLLAILGLPDELADALADWIDEDGQPQPRQGAEDAYYLALDPPYLAANRPLTDLSELALVRGFDAGVRTRLRPYVTALPRFTAVNVNTAPPEALVAVIEGLELRDAQVLVAQRDRVYYRSVDDFINRLPRGAEAAASDISVSSNYFLATLRVTIGGAQARGAALLARGASGWPAIVWRKYL
ncbi:MAG: general secretion pathway protein GspK [Betaproteobacteria bacterium RIFCSPLOWO2_12_FULL_67_28]|nr:MAG: general secretion pathway protein GspK [Betaproteobacteria bacterium RIFCSPLOWO2_02_FULL_68_150]OGA63136.1 MAG: general secretion pathway protein GspK [Betaproteobacteria bacterium RIFCSPLOWO2_12_FULL_67_28]